MGGFLAAMDPWGWESSGSGSIGVVFKQLWFRRGRAFSSSGSFRGRVSRSSGSVREVNVVIFLGF